MPISAALATVSTDASPPARSPEVGQDAVWTEPSSNQLHASSAANDTTRRQQTQQRRQRDAQRKRSGGLADIGLVVGALLDELEVVIAERPEERFGDLQRAGVVVTVERLGRLGDDLVERGEHQTHPARA